MLLCVELAAADRNISTSDRIEVSASRQASSLALSIYIYTHIHKNKKNIYTILNWIDLSRNKTC